MKRWMIDGNEQIGHSSRIGGALGHGVSIICFSRLQRLRLRKWLLLLAALCMASCDSIEPRPPETDASYLMNYAPARKSISVTDVDQARALLDGYRAVLEDGASGRLNYEDVINELTFYGTLVAVVGIAAKSIATRNIGAGVAGISTTVDGHYKLDKQSLAFNSAYNRATCVLTALNGIDLETYALFDQKPLDDVAGNNGLRLDDAYAQIPNETMGAIQSINTMLQADLANISLASGSLSDIQKTAASVVTAAKGAETIKPQDASQQTQNALDVSKVNLDVAKANSRRSPAQVGMLVRQDSTAKSAIEVAQATIAARQQDADNATIAVAAESAKKTVFLKSVAQFAAASTACTKASP